MSVKVLFIFDINIFVIKYISHHLFSFKRINLLKFFTIHVSFQSWMALHKTYILFS